MNILLTPIIDISLLFTMTFTLSQSGIGKLLVRVPIGRLRLSSQPSATQYSHVCSQMNGFIFFFFSFLVVYSWNLFSNFFRFQIQLRRSCPCTSSGRCSRFLRNCCICSIRNPLSVSFLIGFYTLFLYTNTYPLCFLFFPLQTFMMLLQSRFRTLDASIAD